MSDVIVPDLRTAESEALSKMLDLPGWVSRDLPNMTREWMDHFVALVGEGNLRWVTFAERRWPDGTETSRGQVMISPAGMERIVAYNARPGANP